MNWINLTDINQLTDIDQNSISQPIIIFKHSTRCSISCMVKDRFERHWPADSKTENVFLLDLLNHRNISNEIAARYHVEHQSPQVLVIKNKQATYVANHNGISADSTVQALN